MPSLTAALTAFIVLSLSLISSQATTHTCSFQYSVLPYTVTRTFSKNVEEQANYCAVSLFDPFQYICARRSCHGTASCSACKPVKFTDQAPGFQIQDAPETTQSCKLEYSISDLSPPGRAVDHSPGAFCRTADNSTYLCSPTGCTNLAKCDDCVAEIRQEDLEVF